MDKGAQRTEGDASLGGPGVLRKGGPGSGRDWTWTTLPPPLLLPEFDSSSP